MVRPSRSANFAVLGTLGLGASLLFACKPTSDEDPAKPIAAEDAPQILAEQLCAQLFECDCALAFIYADVAECVEYESANIAAAIDPYLDNGGSWDAECAGRFAAATSAWACLGPTLASREAGFDARACPLVKGTNATGSPCTRTTLGDDCQPGLTCVAETCVEALALPVPEGQPCRYDWDTLPCEAGTWCAWTDDGSQQVCERLPVEGDACTIDDYLCGPSNNDLICDQATLSCVAAPVDGAPCFEGFLCGPGYYCDGGQDTTCQPRQELGEGCGADTVCPVDASCEANVCEADPAAVCSALAWF